MRFLSQVLSSVSDKAGKTEITYDTSAGHTYYNDDLENLLGRTEKRFHNVCSTLTTRAPDNAQSVLLSTQFAHSDYLGVGSTGLGLMTDSINGSPTMVPHRWSNVITKDFSFNDDTHVIHERFIWNRRTVEPFFSTAIEPGYEYRDDLYHFYPYVYRRTDWAKQLEIVRVDSAIDVKSRFVVLPVSEVTRFRRFQNVPFAMRSKRTHTYSFECLGDAFTKPELDTLHRRLVQSRNTTFYFPEIPSTGFGSLPAEPFQHSTTTFLNLGYTVSEDCSIKDSTLDELRTRRMIDSARSRDHWSYLRSNITPSAPVSRDVRLAPLLGLYDLVVRTDTAGKVLGGIDNKWYTDYECTESGSVPTHPRGGLQWSDRLGSGNLGVNVDSVPRIREATISYTNSHARMLPRLVTSTYGTKYSMFYGDDVLSVNVRHSDTSTTSHSLVDDDFLGNGLLQSDYSIRYANLVGTMQTRGIEQWGSATYDGSMSLHSDPNAVASASRVDNHNLTSYAWGTGDFPALWKQRHPWVKLWDAQSKRSIETPAPTPHQYDEYDARRLVLMNPWHIDSKGWADSSSATVRSEIQLAYHAHSTDILHTQLSADSIILRLNLVEMYADDAHYGSTIHFDVIFSSPDLAEQVVQSYEVLSLGHVRYSLDSGVVGVLDIALDHDVVEFIHSMSSGDSLSIVIRLDTTLITYNGFTPYFMEFAAHAEDVAPRLLCFTSGIEHNSADETTADFSSKTVYDRISSSLTSFDKLDDSLHTVDIANWNESVLGLAGRYVGGRVQLVDSTMTIKLGDYQGNPLSGAFSPTWSQVKHSVGGSLREVIYPTNVSRLFVDHNTALDTSYLRLHADNSLSRPTFNHYIEGTYGSVMRSISEDSLIVRTMAYNFFGQLASDQIGLGTGSLDVHYFYSRATQLLDSIRLPDSNLVRFVYDAFNRPVRVKHPDLGPAKLKYDNRSLLRFTQTTIQAPIDEGASRVSFCEYDDAGRPTLIGEALLDEETTFELLDSSAISNGSYLDTTFNRTVFDTSCTRKPSIVSMKRTSATCLPSWGTRKPPYESPLINPADAFVRPVSTIPYLGPVQQFVTPANDGNFENVKHFPEHVRQAIAYDEVPNINLPRLPGPVWGGLPPRQNLQCLTPHNKFRNLVGRIAAIAYRDHGKDQFWYKVYSYTESGQIESEIRIDGSLGIGVTYFEYNSSGLLISVRTVDAIRNHATWYDYDDAGRLSKLWTALSALGAQYGLGFSTSNAPVAWRCFSVMIENFVGRPEDPDVTYSYDIMGRLTNKVYHNADVSGNVADSAEFNWQFALSQKRATIATTPETLVSEQVLAYRTDMRVDSIAVATRAVSRVSNIVYDRFGRLDTITTTVEPHLDFELDAISRRISSQEFGTGEDTAHRTFGYVTTGTHLTSVDNDDDSTESMDLQWDPQGRVSKRIIRINGNTSEEQFDFGYHDRLINLRITDPTRTDTCTFTQPDDSSNYSQKETWTYRYSPSGHREQKRLMTSPMHDRSPCGVAPWTAYVRAPSGTTLAVYHGRQTSENPCTPNGFGQYERRVHIYPVEFRSYGPDGINVIFERNNAGNWVKRFITTDRQGSILAVGDEAGHTEATTYDEFGTPMNTYNRRSGWLDRERDYETSPLATKHKLYDLDARKYDASTGQFLSVDPLWASNLHQGSYVYCGADPVNMIDPWGLAGQGGGNGSIKSDIGTSPWSTNDYSDEFGIFDSSHEYRLATPLAPGVDRWHWGYRHRYASSRTRWASDNAGPLPFHGDGQFVGNNLNAGNVGGLKSGGDIGFRSGRGTASNPIVYREVVVEAQSSGGTWGTAIGLTVDWALGTGANNRTFSNDAVANSFRDARVINQARDYWYNQVNTGKKTINNGVANFLGRKAWTGGNFGVKGLVAAGLDPMEQFVGSFTPTISSDGRNLTFTIQNTTSFRSLMYGIAPDWLRSTWGPGGNMTQTYIFIEPINFNRIR